MADSVDRRHAVMSDELAEHFATLLMHQRPPGEDDELTVSIYPKRCELCRRLEAWAKEVAGDA